MRPQIKISPYQVDTKYWRLYINVEQATIEQSDLFFASSVPSEEIRDYVIKNATLIYSNSIIDKLKRLNKRDLILSTVLTENDIYEFVIEKRYRMYNSLYKGIDSWSNRKMLAWLELISIYKNYWITPKDLQENYTYEQLWYMLDRLTFQSYEMWDKTKGLNDRMFRETGQKKISKKDEELIKLIESQR